MKNDPRKIIGIILLIGAVTITCSTLSTRDLLKIHLEMSKEQVQAVLDKPVTVKESLTNNYGQLVEVWEYQLYKPDENHPTKYWLYFHDDVLVKWCEGGDHRRWLDEADEVMAKRF
jgi:hypothetical protein